MMTASALGVSLALPVSAQSSSPAFSASPEGSRAGKTAKMPVYPIPQKMTRSGGSVTVPALKLLGARDEPTVNALKSMFSLAPNGLPADDYHQRKQKACRECSPEGRGLFPERYASGNTDDGV